MKASVKLMLPGFTGNMDDVVIYYNSKLNKFIARRKVSPKQTPDTTMVKDIHAFRRRIGVTEAYINDCREYIKLFNRKYRKQGRAMIAWSNVYMKIMRALKQQYPDISFSSLSREEVMQRNLACKSVSDAVLAGYLDRVPGFERLNNEI